MHNSGNAHQWQDEWDISEQGELNEEPQNIHMQTAQQELPFALEGNTLSREGVRKISTQVDGLRRVALEIIDIRKNFNARLNLLGLEESMYELTLGIPTLADAIFNNNGPADPVRGDFYEGDSKFYPTEGERRIRALRHLMRTGREIYPNGKFVREVLVMINPAGTTDLERKRMITSTQNNLKLKPMELAHHYLGYKTQYGFSHEQIAEFEGISRQTVDNYILATELPISVQVDIDNDVVKLTNALSDMRKAKAAEKRKSLKVVDGETGEVLGSLPAAGAHNPSGDENEFLDKQDNSITSAGSMGGPKEGGSGAVAIRNDSIYMEGQKLALWKQFVHRYEKVKQDVMMNAIDDTSILYKWEDIVAERLKNEYNLTTK